MTLLFIPITATFSLECAICKMLRCKKSHRHNLSLLSGINVKTLIKFFDFPVWPSF